MLHTGDVKTIHDRPTGIDSCGGWRGGGGGGGGEWARPLEFRGLTLT